MPAPEPLTDLAIDPPWSTVRQVVPLLDLEGQIGERVRGLKAKQVNLYRSLAHTPDLLDAWISWAWALRERCSTPRSLREIMILRTAVVMRSEYEWRQHVAMAWAAGVPDDKVRAVTAWQTSDLYDPAERAALMLTDAMLTGNVVDAVHEELARHFTDSERVELILTAGFYAMVPRVSTPAGFPSRRTKHHRDRPPPGSAQLRPEAHGGEEPEHRRCSAAIQRGLACSLQPCQTHSWRSSLSRDDAASDTFTPHRYPRGHGVNPNRATKGNRGHEGHDPTSC